MSRWHRKGGERETERCAFAGDHEARTAFDCGFNPDDFHLSKMIPFAPSLPFNS